MIVYTLIEGSKRNNTAFMAEHSLCLYFEQGGKRILFDTGASDKFIYNATLLGIDLAKVDVCVISHAHGNQTGGLSYFLDINHDAKVYMKTAATGDFYIKQLNKEEKTGIDPEIFRTYAGRISLFDDDLEIGDGVTASSINQYRHLPLHTAMMYEKQNDEMIRDGLSHELFIAAKTPKGVTVLTGCSHHGLLNILMTADEKFGRVTGVVGGFHLDGRKNPGFPNIKEPAAEVRAITHYLNDNKIKNVYTGYCTGEKATERLALWTRTKRMYAGDIIEV